MTFGFEASMMWKVMIATDVSIFSIQG